MAPLFTKCEKVKMATKPGVLTDWPWKSLGNFKYLLLAPFVVHTTHSYVASGEKERDTVGILIFAFILLRIFHTQLWISLSRYHTKTRRIVDKPIEFDQVDRESNWDDQIIMIGLLTYIGYMVVPGASHTPLWRTDGMVLLCLLHAGPVEFLYYWLHRALHHHYLYSRYHSHHHSFIVTEPITGVIYPFVEMMLYLLLFSIPELTLLMTGTTSIAANFGYMLYVDFMNFVGHCNFEFVPTWLFSIFPPLKYLMYTPSYHSLHHTQFRTNYALFMPIYDYIYGTMDEFSDTLHQTSLQKPKENPNVVHLTHLGTAEFIYHLRLVSASLSSRPQNTLSAWYMWIMWPFRFLITLSTWLCGRAIVIERNTFKQLVTQTWLLPKNTLQFHSKSETTARNELIEKAILEVAKSGAKVLSLGLLNLEEEVSTAGELYIEKNPKSKLKLVDGSSLAAAIVLYSIPQGTSQVLLVGKLNKVSGAVASALFHRNIKVNVLHEDAYKQLGLLKESKENLMLTGSYDHKIWLVGEGLSENEQVNAPKGAVFIPFNQFPPKRVRKDCFYYTTPAMLAPKSLQNLDSCEDWLPRRVVSAWRIAGIVHALEQWDIHEFGPNSAFSIDKVWKAAIKHGFCPLQVSI